MTNGLDNNYFAQARRRTLRHRMERLLKESFTALDIAEPLPSLDWTTDDATIDDFMKSHGIKVVGLRLGGFVSAYAQMDEAGGIGFERHEEIPIDMVLTSHAPIGDAIIRLNEHPFCFISTIGGIEGILTKADVSKPPARMWLFGMVTIIEIYLSRLISIHFPGDSWQDHISKGRLEKARALKKERERRGESVALIDCLQVADKAGLILKDKELRKDFDVNSKREARELIKHFESLRNNLAHAQDIVAYNWPAIHRMASRVDRILSRLI